MSDDAAAARKSARGYWLIHLAFMAALVGIVSVAAVVALDKIERAVAVIERVEKRFQDVGDGVRPLGRAALEKGQAAVDRLDAAGMTDAAQDGVKEVGRAAKDRALEFLKTKQPPKPAP